MSPVVVLIIVAVYFSLLVLISYLTSHEVDSSTFFNGNRQSTWYLVAFGMIGASLSGITFISVPGIVANSNFFYFQMVLGYLLGYAAIALMLIPLYYKLNLVSIYGYLDTRFGTYSYKTGSLFFLVSQAIGASLRLFVVAGVLQLAFFDHLNIPFFVTVSITIILIWLYTNKGGIKTIVWTDTFQTLFMLASVCISMVIVVQKLDLSFGGMVDTIQQHPYSSIFNWEWKHDKNFYKQFVAGAFIAIVMNGLDQNMMQKNLTCKNLKEAQKNVFWFSISLVFTNLLFLSFGVLLYIYSFENGLDLAITSEGRFLDTDKLYTNLALNEFGPIAGVVFLLGITAAAFSSADSALTSLTTVFCSDFLVLDKKTESEKIRIRNYVHIAFSFLLLTIIMIFKAVNNDSVINSVFTMAGYTYGPLLGMYAFGLFTHRLVLDRWVPFICVVSPVISYFIEEYFSSSFGFSFGFSILLVNGFLTFVGLWILNKQEDDIVGG